MKNRKKSFVFAYLALIAFLIMSYTPLLQQSSRDKRIIADSKDAQVEFIKGDHLLKNLFNNAYGYVIFPNVGKGGFGFGGATGNGAVYQKGALIGMARMSQLTIGFQAGGNAYREVIFFENKNALDIFKNNNIEFSAQVSATLVAEGASANVKYNDGVMIFTQTKGGLMYEASVGGQKFTFRSF